MKWHLYDIDKEHKGIKSRKIIVVCLMLVLVTGVLGGCGNGSPAASTKGADSTKEGTTSGTQTGTEDTQAGIEGTGNENKAMGRYVESSVDVSEYTTLSCGVTQLSDGRFVILDKEAGMLVSEDGGATWRAEAIPGIPDLAAFYQGQLYLYHEGGYRRHDRSTVIPQHRRDRRFSYGTDSDRAGRQHPDDSGTDSRRGRICT